ncbi:glycosyl hydrolase [Aureococcus anophagefferens]|nr:glycosyl hydrolase [Aureococcus anophagefferens]
MPSSHRFLAPEVPGKSSKNVAIHGSAGEPLRLARGGWITLLLNNASHAVVRHVDVAAARDGVNVISSRHVKLDRLHVRGGSDDAIALKSDWALRRIGSETVGNISDILFHNVTVLGAAKAAMSIVTMDGPTSPGPLRRIRAQNVQALAFIVVGARLRRPGIGDAQVVMDEWIGTISDVSINNVLAHGRWTSGSKRSVPAYEALENHPLGPRISITNVRAEVWGKGEAAMKLWEPAHNPKSYVERNVGPSPAFGAFVRNAVDVTLEVGRARRTTTTGRPSSSTASAATASSTPPRTGARRAPSTWACATPPTSPSTAGSAVDEGAFEVRQRIKPPLNSGLPYPPAATRNALGQDAPGLVRSSSAQDAAKPRGVVRGARERRGPSRALPEHDRQLAVPERRDEGADADVVRRRGPAVLQERRVGRRVEPQPPLVAERRQERGDAVAAEPVGHAARGAAAAPVEDLDARVLDGAARGLEPRRLVSRLVAQQPRGLAVFGPDHDVAGRRREVEEVGDRRPGVGAHGPVGAVDERRRRAAAAAEAASLALLQNGAKNPPVSPSCGRNRRHRSSGGASCFGGKRLPPSSSRRDAAAVVLQGAHVVSPGRAGSGDAAAASSSVGSRRSTSATTASFSTGFNEHVL